MAEIWGAIAGAVIATGVGAALAPGAPDAPNYAAANREAIQADIDTLPLRRMIESAAKQGTAVLKEGYTKREVSGDAATTAAQKAIEAAQAKLKATPKELVTVAIDPTLRNSPSGGRIETKSPNPAYGEAEAAVLAARAAYDKAATQGTGAKTTQYLDASGNVVNAKDAILADFTGYGDADTSRAALDYQLESADKTAGGILALQQKYGPEFIAQRLKELELSDPTGFKLRKDMGQQVSDELAQGYKLAPGMREEVEQATRGAQAARGNVLGAAPAAAESLEIGNAGYRLWQQRLANAASFLSGTTPVAQFGQIAGGQQGAAPFAPQNPAAGLNVNPNAGAQGAQFAQQTYGQQTNQWQTATQNNPWATLFGSVSGAGVDAAGSILTKRYGG